MKSGFTLIEILLVTLLLAFLALVTFSTVRGTIVVKEDIDNKTEIMQGRRAVYSIMERDFRLAFYVVPEDLGWNPRKPPSNPTDQPLNPPPQPKPLPLTFFQGEPNFVFFSSRSHQRFSADSPENEQHFVTYQLDKQNLVRAESPRLVSTKERENKDLYHALTLLPNVKTFKLEYWDRKNDRWSDQWDTEKADYKDRLPAAVRVSLEYTPDIEEGRRKVEDESMVTIFAVTQSVFKPDIDTTILAGPPVGAVTPPTGGR